MEIREGDYFRWNYKTDELNNQRKYWSSNNLIYWCKDQKCVARFNQYEGKILLEDTYWRGPFDQISNSNVFVVSPDRVDLEFICNLNEVRLINSYDKEDYDVVYDLSHQHYSYKQYAVPKYAEKSNKAILNKLEKELERANWEKKCIESSIESLSLQIEEIKSKM